MLKSNKVLNRLDNQSMTGGFTLLEMVVVIGIIAILALIALPSQLNRLNQSKLAETIKLAEGFKDPIAAFYQLNGKFPADNEEAGMPEADKILGSYLSGLNVENGVMHLQLGNKPASFQGEILSIVPVFVEGSQNSPISWICGGNKIPEGMTAAGDNKTSVSVNFLPLSCR